MKNMKLITETWNRFVNEEVGGQVTAPSAWVFTKGPVPGLEIDDRVVLVVWKVEGDTAYYSLYMPEAPKIRDPQDPEHVWPNAYSALRDGLQVEDLPQADGFGGQAMKMPVDQLAQVAKPF